MDKPEKMTLEELDETLEELERLKLIQRWPGFTVRYFSSYIARAARHLKDAIESKNHD